MKKVLNSLLVAILALSATITPVMAEETIVDTTPVDGIIITTPTEGETDTTVTETPTENNTNTGSNQNPSSNTGGLKDDLYDADGILVDSSFDLDNFFDRLIVKMKNLVEGVRRTAVPFLVLAWIIMFIVAILRIISGERGVSAALLSGIFFITIAYIGVVSAEGILYSLANFIVG